MISALTIWEKKKNRNFVEVYFHILNHFTCTKQGKGSCMLFLYNHLTFEISMWLSVGVVQSEEVF